MSYLCDRVTSIRYSISKKMDQDRRPKVCLDNNLFRFFANLKKNSLKIFNL